MVSYKPIPFAIIVYRMNYLMIYFGSYFIFKSGYTTSLKYKPQAGTDVPATERSLLSMVERMDSTAFLPLPISINVPTMARTMFRKKRLAEMINNRRPSLIHFHYSL